MKKSLVVATLDERELAIRMTEAAFGIKRPEGKSIEECLATFPPLWGQRFMAASKVAIEYMKECIANGEPIS